MSEIISSFNQLVELVQEFSGGRDPITGQTLETPQVVDDLNPPATKKAVQDLEQQLELKLPDELQQLLAVHDGQNEKGPPAFGLYSFSPISQMANRYTSHKSMPGDQKQDQPDDERLQPYYWHLGWLPIGHWEQSELMVDLAPSSKGTPGQVFILGHAGFASLVIAPSLNDFLQLTIKKLNGAPDFGFEYEPLAQ